MFESFDEHRIATSEADIYLRTAGQGPPVLLLHGYPQTHAIWHAVAPRLIDRFSLVIPDLRGYGESKGPPPDPKHFNYSKRSMARDMVEVMRSLGHKRFMVAGHDRGGRVGYRLAFDHPERVSHLAAIDIIPTLTAAAGMDKDKALNSYHWIFLAQPAPLPERLIGHDPEFYLRHLLDRWAGHREALDPDAVAQYIRHFRKSSVIEATCEDYRAGMSIDLEHDRADREAGLKIRCPTLVLWGKRYLSAKAQSPLAVWRDWAQEVFEISLDCGHFVPEEQPQACADALREFFSS